MFPARPRSRTRVLSCSDSPLWLFLLLPDLVLPAPFGLVGWDWIPSPFPPLTRDWRSEESSCFVLVWLLLLESCDNEGIERPVRILGLVDPGIGAAFFGVTNGFCVSPTPGPCRNDFSSFRFLVADSSSLLCPRHLPSRPSCTTPPADRPGLCRKHL